MKLDDDVVRNIAELAQLDLSSDQLSAVGSNLGKILDFVEAMNQIDTRGVVPMANPLDQTQRLRADEVTETNQRDVFQNLAPETEDGLYLVPRVVE